MGSGVGEDGHPFLGQLGLRRSRELAGYAGEGDPAGLGDVVDIHLGDLHVEGLLLVVVVAYLQGVPEPLPLGPLGCVETLYLEVRVVL